jgi:ABC-2 type transport system permease protein
MNTHVFSDTSVMLGRSLRHVTRSMDTIITVTIMPIAFLLLFVYVFGGAIRAGTDNYVNYLLPGILLIAIASGISYTAFRLFNDLQSGIFERFHSMPIARSSVLWGHVLTSLVSNAISVVVIVLVALLMGFRSPAGVLAWLAVAGILVLFTLTLTWIAVIAGLSAKSTDGAAAFSYPIIFLPFVSRSGIPGTTNCCRTPKRVRIRTRGHCPTVNRRRYRQEVIAAMRRSSNDEAGHGVSSVGRGRRGLGP